VEIPRSVSLDCYFVCNTYYHADNAIGEHSDSDAHWGAIDGESVILSYTYDQAGIMLIFPSSDAKYNLDKTFLNSLWPTGDYPKGTNKSAQLIGNQVIEAVLLRPNSMLAMGGFFQGQMLHETVPHRVIEAITDLVMDNQPLKFPGNSDFQGYLTKLMNCEGWITTLKAYLVLQSKTLSQRAVITLRHVVNHDALCLLHN